MGQTVSVEKDKKLKSVEVNQNILGLLLSASAKSGQVIDFAKALEYPLGPVPLSLANPDGSRRVTSKSKLLKVILNTATAKFYIQEKANHQGRLSAQLLLT